VVADDRPADISLLEEYRSKVNTRSTGEYTILKVAEMLQSEHMHALPGQAKRAAILVALQAAGVKPTDVIDDAVQRSEVLANAERNREKALREFELRKEEANRKVQAMVQSLVAEYDARIQRTKEEISAERDKFAEWRRTKAEEEQKIAGAVSYLMNENVPAA
jgi:DNA gyrase/topoisomerase IV subunit A